MKIRLLLLLLIVPAASGLDGTVWYDSKGEVVVVEGSSARPAPELFVPEWRKREIERRARHYQPRDFYENWRTPRYFGSRFGSRGFRGSGYRSYCRPVHYRGSYGCYRTTSGRFSACFSSGYGARIGVTIR